MDGWLKTIQKFLTYRIVTFPYNNCTTILSPNPREGLRKTAGVESRTERKVKPSFLYRFNGQRDTKRLSQHPTLHGRTWVCP